MLSIPGNRIKGFCDGLSRRNFLRIGSLGLGGLSLTDLLRAEAAALYNLAVCRAAVARHRLPPELADAAAARLRGLRRALQRLPRLFRERVRSDLARRKGARCRRRFRIWDERRIHPRGEEADGVEIDDLGCHQVHEGTVEG